MVDFDPLDPNAIRAAREAVRVGKEIIGSVTGGKADSDEREPESPGDSSEHAAPPQPNQPETVAEINNPTIHAAGNVTINNYITNMPASTTPIDSVETPCCHDYPDGLCPHRRRQ